jgi:hypothetical protein
LKTLFRFAAVFATALVAAPGALAQGCAMCYTLAQAQDSRAARHLDYAILVLLVPSVSLFAGVFIAAMRRSYGESAERDLQDVSPASAGPQRLPSPPSQPFSIES